MSLGHKVLLLVCILSIGAFNVAFAVMEQKFYRFNNDFDELKEVKLSPFASRIVGAGVQAR